LKIENGQIKIIYMARSSNINDIYQIIEQITNNFQNYKVENK